MQKLITLGALASLMTNLNDNLMGIGSLKWAVPMLPIGLYI